MGSPNGLRCMWMAQASHARRRRTASIRKGSWLSHQPPLAPKRELLLPLIHRGASLHGQIPEFVRAQLTQGAAAAILHPTSGVKTGRHLPISARTISLPLRMRCRHVLMQCKRSHRQGWS